MIRKEPFLVLLLLSGPLTGCGDKTFPPPPRIGSVQIDRMGRAATNTAITDPFFGAVGQPSQAAHEAFQDRYNADAEPAAWVTRYSGVIAPNLALLDGLDTVCGNQLLAGPTTAPGRYSTLAAILADDRLFVNTESGACELYLAVEANAAGLRNNDCGGRQPNQDTVDATYSALAVGLLTGVGDGIDRDADNDHSTTTFPFLGAPVAR
jgi:hypothetical protein